MKKGIKSAIAFLSLALSAQIATASFNNPENIQNVTAPYVTSDYAKTKYPIVLAHGMAGFIKLGSDSVGIDYWYQIPQNLARNGANVWFGRMSPFNSSEVRGEQFLQEVQDILAITGAQKVNLIGHSHGTNSVRYVAAMIPDRVASLTNIAGANRGTIIADDVIKLASDLHITPLVQTILNTFSAAIVFAQGLNPTLYPHDAMASGKSNTIAGAAEFNKKFPMGIPTTACGDGTSQENGIQLFSMSGSKVFTNVLDPVDYALTAADTLSLYKTGINDGIVSVCTSKFGKTIRSDYAWNHFDEVNQVLGIRGLFSQDPVQVYREHANRLKLIGL